MKDLSTDCVDLKLFCYLKSKLINILFFASFLNLHHLHAHFPNSKGPWPHIQISRKITEGNTCWVAKSKSADFSAET